MVRREVMDKSFYLCLVLLVGLSIVPLFNADQGKRDPASKTKGLIKVQMSTEFVGRDVVNRPK